MRVLVALLLTAAAFVAPTNTTANVGQNPCVGAGYAHAKSVIDTYVKGTFEGCDFDRLIPLDNGLIFHCAEYFYHYAYHPEVQVIVLDDGRAIVSIDGRRYSGSLLRSNE